MISQIIMCTLMLTGADGVKSAYAMKGRLALQANDGVNLYVDFDPYLKYNNFKPFGYPKLVPKSECWNSRYKSMDDQDYPENDG